MIHWQTHFLTSVRLAVLEAAEPQALLLFLPEADNLVPETLATLADNHITIIVPTGADSWWAERVCSAFSPPRSGTAVVLEEMVPWMQQRWPQKPIALAGVGVGGQGALRLALRFAEKFPIVAAWEAALDHYERFGHGTLLDEMYTSREQCRQDGALLHIHPTHQPRHIWFTHASGSATQRGNDRLHEKLTALGVAHGYETSPQLDIAKLLDFLQTAWALESRRLL